MSRRLSQKYPGIGDLLLNEVSAGLPACADMAETDVCLECGGRLHIVEPVHPQVVRLTRGAWMLPGADTLTKARDLNFALYFFIMCFQISSSGYFCFYSVVGSAL